MIVERIAEVIDALRQQNFEPARVYVSTNVPAPDKIAEVPVERSPLFSNAHISGFILEIADGAKVAFQA